ncbi:MAG: methyltransferase domain-containing protein [Saprospiraceae bacterium]|nr:methyltransferase domain-containing protein [Saprospiraceae bacterium]
MVKQIDFSQVTNIVELGAGDGVITHHILRKMRPDAKLFAFELLANMCDDLRKIKDPRLIIIEDSAEKLAMYMEQYGVKEVDAILSALPLVAFPDDLAYKIVNQCKAVLKSGGRYVQVHYSLLAKKIYDNVFGNVNISFVPINVPPAFVLVSEK